STACASSRQKLTSLHVSDAEFRVRASRYYAIWRDGYAPIAVTEKQYSILESALDNPGFSFSPHDSKRVGTGFAGPDSHGLVDGVDKDLAIPDLAGLGGADDRIDHGIDPVVVHRHFKFDLGQKIHRILGAAIQFGVPFLAPVAAHLRHGRSVNADFGQGFPHIIHAKRLDDGSDHFH